jgi:hypothetical protein
MIPRYQAILIGILLIASLAMGGLLWHMRQRAHQRLLEGDDPTPTQAPAVAPAVDARLELASDANNAVTEQVLALPLPQNSEERARAILGKLLDLYAAPDSMHPVPGGANSIVEVFLLPVPPSPGSENSALSTDQLAVVNLTGAFATSHPSGLQAESLTILSICATLHANMPQVAQVRFLVDGQPKPTLAGHADLSRTYLTGETLPVSGAVQP